MDLDQTQAIELADLNDDTDDEIEEREKKAVSSLKVLRQKGFPETNFPLYEGDNVIGRQQDICNIYIPIKALSKQHACIEIRGDSHLIYDKGSRNKTKRGKLYLSPDVRYEIRHGDKICLADVNCVYQLQSGMGEERCDSGSETGSESMFQTAPVTESSIPDTQEDEARRKFVEVTRDNIRDEDQSSNASSDLLQPTQLFGTALGEKARKGRLHEATTLMFAEDSDHSEEETSRSKIRKNVTVAETPAVSRTAPAEEASSVVLSESDNENDSSEAVQTLAYDDEKDSSVDKELLMAPTQAYVLESDVEDEDQGTNDLLTEPTQMYGTELDETREGETTSDGLTLAYDITLEEGEAVDTSAATQAYSPAAKDVEPTQAYDMEVSPVKVQVSTGDRKNRGKYFGVSRDTASDNSVDRNEKQSESSTQHIEVIQDTCAEDESNQDFFDAPTMACDLATSDEGGEGEEVLTEPVEEETAQHVPGDTTQRLQEETTQHLEEETTQRLQEAPSKPVEEDSTQAFETVQIATELESPLNSKNQSPKGKMKVASASSPTVIFDGGCTLVLGEDDDIRGERREEPTQVLADDGPTKVLADDGPTQVLAEDRPTLVLAEDGPTQMLAGDGPTQVLAEDGPTQALAEDGPTQVLAGDGPTQVFDVKSESGKSSETEAETCPVSVSDTVDVREGDDSAETTGPTLMLCEEDMVCKVDHKTKGKKEVSHDEMVGPGKSVQSAAGDGPVKGGEKGGTSNKRRKGKGSRVLIGEEETVSNQPFTGGSTETRTPGKSTETSQHQLDGNQSTTSSRQRRKRRGQELEATQMYDKDLTIDIKAKSSSAERETEQTKGQSEERVSMDSETKDQLDLKQNTSNEAEDMDSTVTGEDCGSNDIHKSTVSRSGRRTKGLDSNEPEMMESRHKGVKGKPAARTRRSMRGLPQPELTVNEVEKQSETENRRKSRGKSKKKGNTDESHSEDKAVEALDLREKFEDSQEKPDPFKPPSNLGDEETLETPEMSVPSSDEIVPDSCDSEDCPPTAIHLPPCSPHKPSLVSPENKKNTSPKRVMFAGLNEDTEHSSSVPSDKSEKQNGEAETDAAIGSRKRKVTRYSIAHSAAETMEKKPTRKTRKSTGSHINLGVTSDLSKVVEPLSQNQKTTVTGTDTRTDTGKTVNKGKAAAMMGRNKGGKRKSAQVKGVQKTQVTDIDKSDIPDTCEDLIGSAVCESTDTSRTEVKTSPKSPKPTTEEQVNIRESASVNKRTTESQDESGPSIIEEGVSTGKRPRRAKMGVSCEDNVDTMNSGPSGRGGRDANTDVRVLPPSKRGRRSTQVTGSAPKVESNSPETVQEAGGLNTRRGRRSTQVTGSALTVESNSPETVQEAGGLNTRRGRRSTQVTGSALTVESNSSPETDQEACGLKTRRGRCSTQVTGSAPIVESNSSPETDQETDGLNTRRGKRSVQVSDSEPKGELVSPLQKVEETDSPSTKRVRYTTRDSQSAPTAKGTLCHEESDDVQTRRGRRSAKGSDSQLKGNSVSLEEVQEMDSPSTKHGRRSTRGRDSSSTAENSLDVQTDGESGVLRTKRGRRNANGSNSNLKSNKVSPTDKQKGLGLKKVSRSDKVKVNEEMEPETSDSESTEGLSSNTKTRRNRKHTATSPTETEQTLMGPPKPPPGGSARVSRQKLTSAHLKADSAIDDDDDFKEGASTKQGRKSTTSKSVTSVETTKQRKQPDTPTSPSVSKTRASPVAISSSPSTRRKSLDPKPKVAFTGVVDENGEKITRDLGGELVSSVYQCTHLVTDKVRRTVKFLCCLARGLPIIVPQWLDSCKDAGLFVDPVPFLVHDKASERQYKFSLKGSVEKASHSSLLTRYKVHVTPSVRPEPSQMKDIIQCAGAEYLSRMPTASDEGVVVISCEEDKKMCESAIQAGVPILSSEFILTGILRQEILTDDFRLFKESPTRNSKRSSSQTGATGTKKRRK